MDSFSASAAGPNGRRQRSWAYIDGDTQFGWSQPKIGSLALSGAATLLPTAFFFAVSTPLMALACLTWLAGIARTLCALDRYMRDDGEVLSIDEHGILDRRVMSRRISWQEIAGICHTDTARSRVVDIMLRWPHETLAEARWRARLGAYIQTGYGVPALTINMILVDGTVSDVLAAIARHRPDLLHPHNRGIPIARAS
jgi:hypothetical protein